MKIEPKMVRVVERAAWIVVVAASIIYVIGVILDRTPRLVDAAWWLVGLVVAWVELRFQRRVIADWRGLATGYRELADEAVSRLEAERNRR